MFPPSSSPLPAPRLTKGLRTSNDHGASDAAGGDSQPWTAARCHRLLRQLESRLAGLRKLKCEDRAAASRQLKRPTQNDEPSKANKRIRFTYSKRRQPEAPASKATPIATPPRSVRTFGAMKAGHSSPAAGQIDFPSPVWRKIREQPRTPRPASKAFPQSLEDQVVSAVPTGLMSELRSLRQSVPEEQYRIYEAIFGWLAGLLRSTMHKVKAPQEIHRKSLLGMCLRKIPACVDDIETWERQVSKENGTESMWKSSNASFELYGQLEAFGSAGKGWRPLRLAVRSHAIFLLSGAIADGLLDAAFVGLLAQLCKHFSCNEEAATIISSMQDVIPAPRSSQSGFGESRSLQPLCGAPGSLDGKKMPGPIFDCLSTIIGNGRLPMRWLSVRAFSNIWASTLEAMASSKTGPSVAEFMCTAMVSLTTGGTDRLSTEHNHAEQTLLSVTAGVTAAAMALDYERESLGSRRKQAWRRIVYVLHRCVVETRQRKRTSKSSNSSMFTLALARYLAVAGAQYPDDTFRRQVKTELQELFARNGADTQLQYRQTILLICSAAQCQSRACAAPSYDALAEICDKMEDLDLPSWFESGLRTDVAFLLAQKTKDLRDLAFAESLPAATNSTRVSTIFSGWRWEEGISEWVLPDTTTTKPSYRRRVQSPHLEILEDAGCSERRRSQTPPVALMPRAKRTMKLTELPDLVNHNVGKVLGSAKASKDGESKGGRGSAPRLKIRRAPIVMSDDWDDLV